MHCHDYHVLQGWTTQQINRSDNVQSEFPIPLLHHLSTPARWKRWYGTQNRTAGWKQHWKNIQKHLTFHANSDMKTLSYLVCTVMYRYIYIVSIFKVVFGRSPDETGQTQQQNFVGILARCSRETGPLPPQISWLRVSWRVCDANEFLEVKSCCFRRHILTYNIL